MTTADVLIVDYGACNLDSVRRAIELCGGSAHCSGDPAELKSASRILLPGVGSFAEAMTRLEEAGWVRALHDEVLGSGIPLLGICLGMQLLADRGNEGVEGERAGNVPGLGFIAGSVEPLRVRDPAERIPHMGWNEVKQTKPHPLWSEIPERKDFYFANSYHLVPADESVVAGRTDYCGGFVSAVARGNVFGVQCHPEKSQKAGLQLIRNFLSWNGTDA